MNQNNEGAGGQQQQHRNSGHDHAHSPYLAHHFDTPQQQFDSTKLGMWLFLGTEILLFSGFFCAYAIYRAHHPEIFIYAHQFLNKNLGALNTAVLIFSSLTMAWAVRAAQLSDQRKLVVLLTITLLCGFIFLGVKYVEYKEKWEHGLLWGSYYHPHQEGHAEAAAHDLIAGHTESATEVIETTTASAPMKNPLDEKSSVALAPKGPAGLAENDLVMDEEGHAIQPKNVQIFFSIYFLMTGLHGLHVIGGLFAIGWILKRSILGHFSSQYFTPVDLVGLYWHLVDLIWIYLFPLLYLIH